MSVVCPSCNTQASDEQKFCGKCGAEIALKKEASSQTREAHAEERRWVTVLFADISGFTSIIQIRESLAGTPILPRFENADSVRQISSLMSV